MGLNNVIFFSRRNHSSKNGYVDTNWTQTSYCVCIIVTTCIKGKSPWVYQSFWRFCFASSEVVRTVVGATLGSVFLVIFVGGLFLAFRFWTARIVRPWLQTMTGLPYSEGTRCISGERDVPLRGNEITTCSHTIPLYKLCKWKSKP